MDILFVAPELSPMAKVGGVADVIAALAKALRLLGHKVTVALPRYPGFAEAGVMLARRLTPIVLSPGASAPRAGGAGESAGARIEVTVFDGRLGSGVELVLLDAPGLYDRPGIYGEGGRDYPDNARRFGVFCRAVVELLRQRAAAGTPFDVVHAHDWPTAMVPYLLSGPASDDSGAATALTIHNVAHQGVFGREALDELGLGDEHFVPERLEFYGKVCFLKGGILSADAVTTVSPTYAREILTPERGERLDGVLRSREGGVVGIANGVDYAVWNPMTDPHIAARYDAEDAANKGRCKSAFLEEARLSIVPDRPLVVSVGRIAHQKGSDQLAAALPKILRSDVAIAVAGAGDDEVAARIAAAAAKAPDRAVYLGAVSEPVVHRMLAAADLVLLPSRYEPCGLVQLYAQRYGAVPVAHRTGGLADTIVDLDAELETGTGFLYDEPTAAGLLGAVQRAIAAATSPRWGALRRRVMRLDLGWDRAARRYVQIYRSLAA